jgi:hypothetical protein
MRGFMKNSIILLFIALGIIAFTACGTNTPITPEDKTVTIDENITQNITFKDGFTYIIKGVVVVKNATVTVQPGANIRFMANARLGFAEAPNDAATIKAIGTPAKPIRFTSNLTNPAKGDWDCIYLYKGAAECEFENCIFEYGGGNTVTKAMVVIKNTKASFKSCTFRQSESVGIYLMVDGSFDDFTMNSVTDCASYPIMVSPNYAHTIGAGNTFSTTSGILVTDDSDLDNVGVYTWANHGTPYIIESDTRIGASGNGVTLNIAAGNILKFMTTAKFTIAYGTSDIATINAIGTPTEKILFTAFSSSPIKQDWKGLSFTAGARNCNFDYCDFTYAGSTVTSSAVLYLNQCGTQVKISNSLIAHSISYGISVDKTTTVDTSTIVFEDIDKETYHVR